MPNPGSNEWYYSTFGIPPQSGSVKQEFSSLFEDNSERYKAKRPTEIAVACLFRAKAGLVAATNDFRALGETPLAVESLINETTITDSFPDTLMAWSSVVMLKQIAQHILGEDAAAFREEYNAIMRDYYERVIVPALKRSVGAVNGPPSSFYLRARRLSDSTVALIWRCFKQGDEMAQDFLARSGYTGEAQIAVGLLNQAFTAVLNEWRTKCFAIASELMGRGALIALIRESQQFYDRVGIYRRRTDTAPRLLVAHSEGAWSLEYKDKSGYAPIRDFVAAGYKHMAYKVDGSAIVPIVDTDDIQELMLDLSLPVNEQNNTTTLACSQLKEIVAANPGVIFKSDHIERYLQPEGFAATTELDAFSLDIPRGSFKDIFSISTVTIPAGASITDSLVFIQNPEVFTAAHMVLFGEKYELKGIGARDYAIYFAAQTLGAVVPYTTETGKVTVQMSDMFGVPTRTIELPDFVGDGVGAGHGHYLDKTLIRRFTTQFLGLSESLIDDSQITVIGQDLLTYYLVVLRILGFEDIAVAVKAAAGYTRASRTNLKSHKMVLTWEQPDSYACRLKAMGVTGDPNLRYKLAMIQVFMSRITNDAVLRAMLHAMSIYLSFDTSDLSSSTIQELWKRGLTSSLL